MRLPGQDSSPLGGIEGAVQSDINVTPLVDVCLVLLIIFMVVTPLLQQGMDVALPETAEPAKMPKGSQQLTVVIQEDGSVMISGHWVQDENVASALEGIFAKSPDKNVVVKAHKGLEYRAVRSLMEKVNAAGFPGVGLVTLEREPGPAGAS